MNNKGEIALAYSVASSTVFPSIRYTGYNAAGVNQSEGTLFAGSGSRPVKRIGTDLYASHYRLLPIVVLCVPQRGLLSATAAPRP